jgi:hypothetical protein
MQEAALEHKAHHIRMSTRLQGGLPIPFPGGDKGPLGENSKELLQLCLKSVHDLSQCYFCWISSDKSILGSLSYLLNMEEGDLNVAIFKICGFYNDKNMVFFNYQLSVLESPRPLRQEKWK